MNTHPAHGGMGSGGNRMECSHIKGAVLLSELPDRTVFGASV